MADYILAIADRTYSSWSLRGWLLFEKFSIPHKLVTARMYLPEFWEMLANFAPAVTVPAMRFSDVVVSDSLAMAETLAEAHAGMWPEDPVARGFARTIVAEMHAGFGALRTDCTMNLRHAYEGFAPSADVLANIARMEELFAQARSRFGNGGPWLFGTYSIADVFFAPVVTRFATYGLPTGPVSRTYMETHLADQAFRQWRAMGLAENYVQPGYDLDLPVIPWPGPAPLDARSVTNRTPINTECPYSGKPVVPDALAEISGKVVGFCNPFCRDKSVADAGAWPKLTALMSKN